MKNLKISCLILGFPCKRLLAINGDSVTRLLVQSFLKQFISLSPITPEGYRLLQGAADCRADFLIDAIGKYVKYQTGDDVKDGWIGIWGELRDRLTAIDHLFISDADKDIHRVNIIRQFTVEYEKKSQISPLPRLPYSTYISLFETLKNGQVRASLSVNILPKTGNFTA